MSITEIERYPVTKEACMGSFKNPRAFDPLDLEIIDRVYEAIWAQIEARYPSREREQDEKRQESLRRWLFARAGAPVDFDTLYEKVLASIPKAWEFTQEHRSPLSEAVRTPKTRATRIGPN